MASVRFFQSDLVKLRLTYLYLYGFTVQHSTLINGEIQHAITTTGGNRVNVSVIGQLEATDKLAITSLGAVHTTLLA